MTSAELDRLVGIGALKRESPTAGEVNGLIRSGRARLGDARRKELSRESRFDLAYNAAHALALAALRRLGYRPTNRYLVFQVPPHSLGLPAAVWRVLASAHDRRNLSEYGGAFDVDERLLDDLLEACEKLASALGT